MRLQTLREHKFFHPAMGAGLVVLCGLGLWGLSLGEPWVHASYDCLFRFGARAVTNKVALILMDQTAHEVLRQTRGQPWDRGIHAQLLNKLTDEGCPIVVFDVFFEKEDEKKSDAELAEAIRRHRRVVLMAGLGDP